MKGQSLFSGKEKKKNILKFHLLKVLPSLQSVNIYGKWEMTGFLLSVLLF